MDNSFSLIVKILPYVVVVKAPKATPYMLYAGLETATYYISFLEIDLI